LHHPVLWHRTPPPTLVPVIFHNWFEYEWNKGLHGYIRRHQRFKTGRSLISYLPETTVAHLQSSSQGPPCTKPIATLPDTMTANGRLLALLFSLLTPSLDNTYHFDPTVECICVDTGASTCISAQKQNLIHMTQVNNLKINGIGSGLPLEGIRILKWSIQDDSGNEIDLFIKVALYVPSAPMGLLCPQQIVQQTGTSGDGFQALAHARLLQFQGYRRTISYEQHTCLPIFHTMECRQAIANLALNANIESAPSRIQQSLL